MARIKTLTSFPSNAPLKERYHDAYRICRDLDGTRYPGSYADDFLRMALGNDAVDAAIASRKAYNALDPLRRIWRLAIVHHMASSRPVQKRGAAILIYEDSPTEDWQWPTYRELEIVSQYFRWADENSHQFRSAEDFHQKREKFLTAARAFFPKHFHQLLNAPSLHRLEPITGREPGRITIVSGVGGQGNG